MRPFTVTLFQNTPISLTPLYLQLISKKEKFGFRSPRALIDAQTKGVPKMSSLSQIAANRSNAQFCTGPTTQAGKESCKMNALRHGLTSKQIVLPHEDREGFERLLTSHRREYDPASPTEEDLIQELAISQWRLLRARRVESEYFAQVFESSSGTTLAALIASDDDKGFQKIQRYLAAAERAWRRALKDLQQAQSVRRKMQREEAREQATTHSRTLDQFLEYAHQIARSPEIGSVPQRVHKDREAPPEIPALDSPITGQQEVAGNRPSEIELQS